MKKFLSSSLALAFAIGMSAFTNIASEPDALWYKDGNQFISFSGTACPEGNEIQCEVEIEGVGIRPLYTQPDDLHPLLTRE